MRDGCRRGLLGLSGFFIEVLKRTITLCTLLYTVL